MQKKQKNRIKDADGEKAAPATPTVFEMSMNCVCEMRKEMGMDPLPHWRQTTPTPDWVKNIYRNFRNTIFKSILKLKPKRKINWRYYGRAIGILERYKTFMASEINDFLKAEGLHKITKKQWRKIQPLLGEDEARQHYLKVLGRPASDSTPLAELSDLVLQKQLHAHETMKQTAFSLLPYQGAKTTEIFLQGMREGYTAFFDTELQFAGDDRRTGIYTELLAWRYDIEKMRRSIPQQQNKQLVNELKKLPEFKSRTHDWFTDVFKDINLSIGRPGRPPKFSTG